MRICLLTDAWTPQINGVVTTLTTLVQKLEESGHDVDVINPSMFWCFPLPTYSEIKVPWNLISVYRKVAKAIDVADHVHIATEGPIGLVARLYCHRHDIPYNTSYHTKFPEYINTRFPAISIDLGYKFMRWMHNRANKVLVTTETMVGELDSWGIKNQIVWSRGVDTDAFQIKSEYKPKDLTIGYVGRLSVEKNIEEFLELPDYLGKKIVVGDGPEYDRLKEQYPDVEFLGYKTGDELVNAYNSMHVMVFPSKTDTFGLVNIEAMACGVPVAAFPVTGPQDIIKNGVNGFMSSNLEEAAYYCFTIEREKCRIHVVDNFSWNTSVQVFLDLIGTNNETAKPTTGEHK